MIDPSTLTENEISYLKDQRNAGASVEQAYANLEKNRDSIPKDYATVNAAKRTARLAKKAVSEDVGILDRIGLAGRAALSAAGTATKGIAEGIGIAGAVAGTGIGTIATSGALKDMGVSPIGFFKEQAKKGIEEFKDAESLSAKAVEYGSMGLDIAASGGLGGVGRVALTKLLPKAAAGVQRGLMARASLGAAEGAIEGAAFSGMQGEKIGEGANVGAVIGGALPIVGSALAGGKRLLGKSVPERIMSRSLSMSNADRKEFLKDIGELPESYILKGKLSPDVSSEEIKGIREAAMDAATNVVRIADTGKTYKNQNIGAGITQLLESISKDASGKTYSELLSDSSSIVKRIDDLQKSGMPASQASQVALNETIERTGKDIGSDITSGIGEDAARSIANIQEIAKKYSSGGITLSDLQTLNRNIGKYIYKEGSNFASENGRKIYSAIKSLIEDETRKAMADPNIRRQIFQVSGKNDANIVKSLNRDVTASHILERAALSRESRNPMALSTMMLGGGIGAAGLGYYLSNTDSMKNLGVGVAVAGAASLIASAVVRPSVARALSKAFNEGKSGKMLKFLNSDMPYSRRFDDKITEGLKNLQEELKNSGIQVSNRVTEPLQKVQTKIVESYQQMKDIASKSKFDGVRVNTKSVVRDIDDLMDEMISNAPKKNAQKIKDSFEEIKSIIPKNPTVKNVVDSVGKVATAVDDIVTDVASRQATESILREVKIATSGEVSKQADDLASLFNAQRDITVGSTVRLEEEAGRVIASKIANEASGIVKQLEDLEEMKKARIASGMKNELSPTQMVQYNKLKKRLAELRADFEDVSKKNPSKVPAEMSSVFDYGTENI